MSTKRLFEISQSATIPIPAWLIILAVGGIFTLAYRVHQWESQLEAMSKAIESAWTAPMERQVWMEYASENRHKAPDLMIPDVMRIWRDN